MLRGNACTIGGLIHNTPSNGVGKMWIVWNPNTMD